MKKWHFRVKWPDTSLTVLDTSKMATVGNSDGTSIKLGVTKDVKCNADATDGLESHSDVSSRHGHNCRRNENHRYMSKDHKNVQLAY